MEAPQRSPAIRPGHLWQNDAAETMQSALKGVRVASQEVSEEILLVLKHQHSEVMQRLEWQDQVLREMKEGKVEGRRRSIFAESVSSGQTVGELMPVPSPTKRAVPDAAVVERLFRTFESIDADLKDGAATVDEKEAARKKRQQSFVSTNAEKGCLVKLTTHPWFDIFFAGVVICNSIFVGVEVSHTIYYKGDTGPFLEVVRYIFAVIFTLELILRISAGGKIFFTSDEWMWNWLDCFIVFTSIWEIVNDLVLQELFKGSDGVTFTGLKALRLVRITRIVKVARLARVLRFVMALRTLISSIIYTLKSLIWAMILLGLIVYVFSVLFAQAVGDVLMFDNNLSEEMEIASMRYFGTLEDTMLSLFMSIAGGVSWEEVVRPLKAISTAWVFVFLFYIAFTYFAVLNVVTGVFCQSAIDSAQNDQTVVLQSILATKQANIEKIRHLFEKIDVEETGVITYKMIESCVTSDEVQTMCESIGIDVWDAWSFFKLLDVDAGGAVEIGEFLEGCLRLRGEARAMDVVKILHDQGWLIRNQSRFWTYMEEQIDELKDRLLELKDEMQTNHSKGKHKK